jgi:hypothetical protein
MYNSGNSSKNVTGASIVDGTVETVDIADDAVTADKLANTVNADIATGVSGSTTAGDALPKTGGAMTGAITSSSTISDNDGNVRAGRKNLIINGGFDVWQRDSSQYAAHSYNADRWISSRTNIVKSTSIYKGLNWLDMSSGATGYLGQFIEGAETGRGKTVTLSFLFNSTASDSYAYFYWSGVTINATTSSTEVISGNIQKYTGTFTLPDSTNTDTKLKMYIQPTTATAIAQVQLEVGSVATDFEHRSYGEELALCQRYYEVVQTHIRFKGVDTNEYSGHGVSFKVEKRTTPTLGTLVKTGDNNVQTFGAYTLGADSVKFVILADSGTTDTYADLSVPADAEI